MRPRHLTALLLALGAAALRADEVTLTTGAVVKGEVVLETDEKVIVQRQSGRVVLDRAMVASVEKTPFVLPSHKAAGAALSKPEAKTEIGTWPPKAGEPYPDLALMDSTGNLFHLSSLKGKVILVEPVAMSSAASQAHSGGDTLGGFLGIEPQPGIQSIDTDLERFAGGLKIDDPSVAYVQVVIYNFDLKAPTVSEVKAWADHFKLTDRPNVHVLVGTPAMQSQASFDMIPGLHLVDQRFVLRSEHFGHGGGSDLYRDLLPMAATLAAPREPAKP
ncbi:MAG TPA: hypothetical protein VFE25_10235 [Opitutaceae bacterium]|jgi:hypothetical protein|nr:hypothetical protein [Opitutaceae bacterium]